MKRKLCKTKTGRVRAHLRSGRCPTGTHEQRVFSNRQSRMSGRNLHLDRQRRAKRPGPRLSRAGNRYNERRPNRSDKPGSRI